MDESRTDGAFDGGTGFKVDVDGIGGDAASAMRTLRLLSYKRHSRDWLYQAQSKDDTKISSLEIWTPRRRVIPPILVSWVSEEHRGRRHNRQLIGNRLTSAGVALALDKSTAGVADLIINDVEIYDATLAPLSTTFRASST